MHHGPAGYTGDWGAVFHRDIIPSNIFLQWEPTGNAVLPAAQATQAYPWTVKLGDFGCAMTINEYVNEDYDLSDDKMPTIDYQFDPPNGSIPDESTDIFQIGLVLTMMYCIDNETANNNDDPTICA
jgi:serine/threonine protein kinase